MIAKHLKSMEQRALKNKGDTFKEYMRKISFFIPMPKRIDNEKYLEN